MNSNNPYLPIIRASYTDATTMRLTRLLAPDANLSLRRLLVRISDYPELLHDKCTGKQTGDIADLDKSATVLKEQLEPLLAARTHSGCARSQKCGLDRAIDLFVGCAKRYYWFVSDSYLDLDSADRRSLAIVRIPWIEPK